MKYKLLCIDLDGTLLDDNKEIPEKVAEAIRRVSRQGAKIALITGRMPAATDYVVERLGTPCILACNAGTYILENERCISEKCLSPETVKGVYKVTEKYGTPLWIFCRKQWFVIRTDDYVRAESELVRCLPEIADVDTLVRKWEKEKTGPNKVLAGAEPETIRKIQEELRRDQPDVEVACSAPTYLEIFPKGMNKGKALKLICQKLGIKKEETIAFGDEELDIPMIEAAGVGIAMGNAIEELKLKADFITKTNNEAGIACALDYYMEVKNG